MARLGDSWRLFKIETYVKLKLRENQNYKMKMETWFEKKKSN